MPSTDYCYEERQNTGQGNRASWRRWALSVIKVIRKEFSHKRHLSEDMN